MLQKCLDDLLWSQQVWNPPFLSINAFGGFASMNSDAEWNDARQGIIAPVLMDCYGITGTGTCSNGEWPRCARASPPCSTRYEEIAPGNMSSTANQTGARFTKITPTWIRQADRRVSGAGLGAAPQYTPLRTR